MELDSLKYGTKCDSSFITNFRALMNDWDKIKDVSDDLPDCTQWFNTENECQIISENVTTYLSKIDLATSRQFVRHRVSFQELSRRYVSGKKAEFEFYVEDDLKEYSNVEDAVDRYNRAIKGGIQPQAARRLLPQSMYTIIWSQWDNSQLDNFFQLRIDKHAQKEIIELATGMRDLLV